MRNWWLYLDKNNRYFEFIEDCRKKIYKEGEILHKHHIIPKYWFKTKEPEALAYCESEENFISLSLEDHTKAHKLLYEMYKNKQDKRAYLMLSGQDKESICIWRTLGAQSVHEKLKSENSNFWNSDFQREMATRSLAHPDALKTRSEGGRVGGRNRNLNRAITKKDRYLFSFENKPVLCVFNCETGGDVLKILHRFKQTKLQRISQLLKGERKTLNGWSCERLNEFIY
jgi:hypothetical protein